MTFSSVSIDRISAKVINDTSQAPPAPPEDTSTMTGLTAVAMTPTENPDTMRLTVSHATFRNFWCFILLFEIINGVVLVVLAYLYLSAPQPDSLVHFLRYGYLFSQAQQFLENYAQSIGVTFAVLAVFFFLNIIELIGFSIYHRRLSFGRVPPVRSTNTSKSLGEIPRWKAVLRFFKNLFEGLLTCYFSFGVRGVHFTAGLFIRESIEISLQTTQALSNSKHLSNLALNQIYGVLIFVNCVSSPILQHIYHDKPVIVRFLCLVVDFVIELWWGTVLPIWMLWPYYREFTDPSDVVANLAPENAAREVEEILILSTQAYVLAVYPFVSALLSLRGMKKLLGYVREERTWKDAVVSFKLPIPVPTRSVVRGQTIVEICGKWCHRLSHLALMAHGVFVLLSSILSSGILQSGGHLPYDCINRLHPWFTQKEACVSRKIDCAAVGIVGNKHELGQILDQFDRPSLSNLQLFNCPALEMPSEAAGFEHLTTIITNNCTIHSWDMDAAVTEANFPSLMTVKIINVTLTDVPIGLGVKEPLASNVEWIAIYQTNAYIFLDLVGDHWKDLVYLYCDDCGLNHIPDAVTHMANLQQITFWDNNITTVPDGTFQLSPDLYSFRLTQDPVTSLPDAVWHCTAWVEVFFIENTLIDAIPSWIGDHAYPSMTLYASGTPYCAAAANNSTAIPAFVSCDAKAAWDTCNLYYSFC
ncbi:TPA: hypothetical protein N0F65_000569 [Lagenidium giganteum]|uniref:Uncharacterized protein n=1 Tax=Lagenidium giganteum TaxID=4803 RepID=A0AAV2Z2V6_9STRA|nr:TPA: hypothetical protein N0F65_000569 [Lagenidium giganteum]